MATSPRGPKKRTTSFLIQESDWRMIKRLNAEKAISGNGRYDSMQQVLDDALDLFRPRLIEEYKRVFGVNPEQAD